jgi:hypothetical protein
VRRWTLPLLGAFSTFAAIVFLNRSGGHAALAIVGNGLAVVLASGAILWLVVSMLASTVDEPRPDTPRPPPDFRFSHNKQPRVNDTSLHTPPPSRQQ